MTKKIFWLLVSGLMVLSLVMAACSQAATTQIGTTTTTTTTSTAPAVAIPQQEVVKPTGEVPKYGGTVTVMASADFTNWDVLVYGGPGGLIKSWPWIIPLMATGQRDPPMATVPMRRPIMARPVSETS